jgi:hypothetical protein
MRKHVAHLLGLRHEVHRVDAQAAVQRAQQQAQRLQSIGHDQRHGVARLCALGTQQRSHAAAAFSELRVVDGTLRVLGRHRVDGRRVPARLPLDQLMDGGRRARRERGAHVAPCCAK